MPRKPRAKTQGSLGKSKDIPAHKQIKAILLTDRKQKIPRKVAIAKIVSDTRLKLFMKALSCLEGKPFLLRLIIFPQDFINCKNRIIAKTLKSYDKLFGYQHSETWDQEEDDWEPFNDYGEPMEPPEPPKQKHFRNIRSIISKSQFDRIVGAVQVHSYVGIKQTSYLISTRLDVEYLELLLTSLDVEDKDFRRLWSGLRERYNHVRKAHHPLRTQKLSLDFEISALRKAIV